VATSNAPLTKQGKTLLARKDDEGTHALLDALQRAPLPQALGAHASENILDQERTPQRQPPPVRLQPAHRNAIRLAEPALAAYEAVVITRTRA
jgi:hypothetical protein